MSKRITVSGRVLSSRVDAYTGPQGGQMYRTRITYEYEVDGQRYVNDRVFAFGPANTSATPLRYLHQTLLARYPAGKEVSVHVNPDNPQDAYLESGMALLKDLFAASSAAAL